MADDKKIISSADIFENSNHHCRAKVLKKFCYTWSIANFWEIYEYTTELYSSNVKDYFTFYMSNTKNSLKFYVIIDKNKSKLTGSYSVFLKTNETDIMCTSKSVHELYNEELLYELPISKWNPTYLSNGTFTICFKFHIFQNLLNSSIYHTYYPFSGEFFFDINENFLFGKRSQDKEMYSLNIYDIKNLKSVCEQYLIINTTIKNVIEHFKIAHLNCGKALEKYAIEFMKLYFEDINNIAAFKTLVLKYTELLNQIKDVKTLKISSAKSYK
ncbi:uncharacterized protein LOC126852938 [Cataglyphis hispanica]|uniref:uncharacterized protein LOC126852938 n=1 Tax=Cataglyphis hispanica TaxID=1086592 RepID=UPI00217FD01C|nr:uncharacterized protein LOC126852938 [Cataglyphis hispanica]